MHTFTSDGKGHYYVVWRDGFGRSYQLTSNIGKLDAARIAAWLNGGTEPTPGELKRAGFLD